MEEAKKHHATAKSFEMHGDTDAALKHYTKALKAMRTCFEDPEVAPSTDQVKFAQAVGKQIELLSAAAKIRGPDYHDVTEKANEYGVPDGFERATEHDVVLGGSGISWRTILQPAIAEGFTSVELIDGWGRFDDIRRFVEMLMVEMPTFRRFKLISKANWRFQRGEGGMKQFEADLQNLADTARMHKSEQRPNGVMIKWSVDNRVHRRMVKIGSKFIFDIDFGLAIHGLPKGDGSYQTRIGFSCDELRPTKLGHVMAYKNTNDDCPEEESDGEEEGNGGDAETTSSSGMGGSNSIGGYSRGYYGDNQRSGSGAGGDGNRGGNGGQSSSSGGNGGGYKRPYYDRDGAYSRDSGSGGGFNKRPYDRR